MFTSQDSTICKQFIHVVEVQAVILLFPTERLINIFTVIEGRISQAFFITFPFIRVNLVLVKKKLQSADNSIATNLCELHRPIPNLMWPVSTDLFVIKVLEMDCVEMDLIDKTGINGVT